MSHLLLPLDMSMVIADSDLVVQQVSQGETWCLILYLVNVWCSPLFLTYLFALF